MAQRGTSFTLKDPKIVETIMEHYQDEIEKVNSDLQKKITTATQMIWAIAHQKRPKVGATKENKGKYRVSDPDAEAGVPVKTGALQISVTKEVERTAKGWRGKISAGGGQVGYAGYMEFGTSKIRPRPFMRPAINLTREPIKRLFDTPIKK